MAHVEKVPARANKRKPPMAAAQTPADGSVTLLDFAHASDAIDAPMTATFVLGDDQRRRASVWLWMSHAWPPSTVEYVLGRRLKHAKTDGSTASGDDDKANTPRAPVACRSTVDGVTVTVVFRIVPRRPMTSGHAPAPAPVPSAAAVSATTAFSIMLFPKNGHMPPPSHVTKSAARPRRLAADRRAVPTPSARAAVQAAAATATATLPPVQTPTTTSSQLASAMAELKKSTDAFIDTHGISALFAADDDDDIGCTPAPAHVDAPPCDARADASGRVTATVLTPTSTHGHRLSIDDVKEYQMSRQLIRADDHAFVARSVAWMESEGGGHRTATIEVSFSEHTALATASYDASVDIVCDVAVVHRNATYSRHRELSPSMTVGEYRERHQARVTVGVASRLPGALANPLALYCTERPDLVLR